MQHVTQKRIALIGLCCLAAACGPSSARDDDGGSAGLDGGLAGDGGVVWEDGGAPPPDSGAAAQLELTGTIRDFQDTHPDFEAALGAESGIVEPALGTDGKPVYAGGEGTVTTHGAEAFNQWFNDVPGVNRSMPFTITLRRGAQGVYTYDNQAFFPADDQLFGNEGRPHNYHFTYELNTEFTYTGGEIFRFTGDDDLWVFINGRLAIDLGGVHAPESAEANLDQLAPMLGISRGQTYALDFFFAERHTTESTFRIDTTIENLTPIVK